MQVVLSNKKLTCPYTLLYGEKEDRIDLVYSYEEDVFIPDDPVSQNLASMVAAQVALNYGLFCKNIILDNIVLSVTHPCVFSMRFTHLIYIQHNNVLFSF